MLPLLPRWNLNPNRSSFYDRDSGTLLELAAKLHSSMNELIDDYNKIIGDINEKLSKFEQYSTADRELFETGLRQEFQDFIDTIDLKIQHIETNGSSDITIDDTLTIEGAAADAKAVSNALSTLLQSVSTSYGVLRSDLTTLDKSVVKTLNGAEPDENGNIGIATGLTLYEQAKMHISRFQHQYMNNIDYPDNKTDIIIFAGQSNSCGRATLESATTNKDFFLTVPQSTAYTFQTGANGTCGTEYLDIVEPLSVNGSTGYGYIPAFLNTYNKITGRDACCCFKSEGGTSIHNWFPYVLDSDGNETTSTTSYYTAIKNAVNHTKQMFTNNKIELGDILLVWCQGENDAAYLGNDTANSYCTEYGTTRKTDEQKIEYYKKGFSRIVEKLKEDVGLSTAFIIRIGHSGNKVMRNEVIIEAQNQLCREHPDCVMVSTIFAGAKNFIEEDGTTRNLMIDNSHYLPEGYLRAGLEAGINAGIYQKSNKMVKPILLEYNTLYKEGTANITDNALYERPIDKYIYDPCRIDFNTLYSFTEDKATSISVNEIPTLKVGDTYQIVATIYPTSVSNKKVLYNVLSPDIISVDDNGLITALQEGETEITISWDPDPNLYIDIVVSVSATGDTGDETTGQVVFDYDFTQNTINDYVLDGLFTIPSGSTVDSISYDSTKGMTLNQNLPNGLNLVEPLDASSAWTLEFTALFVTPTVLAGNRRAFLAGDNLYPFVFINGTTFDNMGFQISNGNHTTSYGILVYDVEADYKIKYDGNGHCEVYVNETLKNTVTVNFAGQQFTVLLGNVPNKSTAYIWQNVEENPSYLKKIKFYYK